MFNCGKYCIRVIGTNNTINIYDSKIQNSTEYGIYYMTQIENELSVAYFKNISVKGCRRAAVYWKADKCSLTILSSFIDNDPNGNRGEALISECDSGMTNVSHSSFYGRKLGWAGGSRIIQVNTQVNKPLN